MKTNDIFNDVSDEIQADLAAQRGEEVELLSDAEIIELLLEEESL